MESLLERIEENRLDALYLFINETLRDRNTFDRFLVNLLQVLPHNWSIQRVEVGHEFLSMIAENEAQQDQLFELICSLESLRTLIISDGYVPRKDLGSVHTPSLLSSLPRARNLINLDLQRIQFSSTDQVELLADVLMALQDSLEEIRITGLFVTMPTEKDEDLEGFLDPAIQACGDMNHLRSLAISAHPSSFTASHEMSEATTSDAAESDGNADGDGERHGQRKQHMPFQRSPQLVSQLCLLELCRNTTSLQDLSLRSMNVDDETCKTIAKALKAPPPSNDAEYDVYNSESRGGGGGGNTTGTPSVDEFHGDGTGPNNESVFLTSLDLRQNSLIGTPGYTAILNSLERNYDLWCTVMVDDDSFQAKFHALIELNQANRGDLVRSPTMEKFILFVEQLRDDPTALWYFLTIHDSILFPLVSYWQWKIKKEEQQRQQKRQMQQMMQQMMQQQQQPQPPQQPGMPHHATALFMNNALLSSFTSFAAAAAAAAGGTNNLDVNPLGGGGGGGGVAASTDINGHKRTLSAATNPSGSSSNGEIDEASGEASSSLSQRESKRSRLSSSTPSLPATAVAVAAAEAAVIANNAGGGATAMFNPATGIPLLPFPASVNGTAAAAAPLSMSTNNVPQLDFAQFLLSNPAASAALAAAAAAGAAGGGKAESSTPSVPLPTSFPPPTIATNPDPNSNGGNTSNTNGPAAVAAAAAASFFSHIMSNFPPPQLQASSLQTQTQAQAQALSANVTPATITSPAVPSTRLPDIITATSTTTKTTTSLPITAKDTSSSVTISPATTDTVTAATTATTAGTTTQNTKQS